MLFMLFAKTRKSLLLSILLLLTAWYGSQAFIATLLFDPMKSALHIIVK